MDGLFQFGEYAGYVWSAYGISLLGLAVLTAVSWRAYAAAKRRAGSLGDGNCS